MNMLSEQSVLEGYIEQWHNNKFPSVLSKISDEDLKQIAPQLDLSLGFSWWNEEVPIYSCVANQIRTDNQWKILLQVDKEGILEVSQDFNSKLYDAISNNDHEMIKIIINHKQFSYPGSGSCNTRFFNPIELSPLHKLVNYSKDKFNESNLDIIKFVYNLLPEQYKDVYIADFFHALKCYNQCTYVRKGLELFV